ncbi:Nucleolar Complex 2 protein [Elasticomyces elasticus]|nr:Nucleolar Complex 2 protein [Elasticomyces elasticus]
MAQSKATKKFEKNHLKDTIKRRKDFSKIKQKQQIKDKRKLRKAKDNEKAADLDGDVKQKKQKTDKSAPFESMSVDEFFQGGFEVPEERKPRGEKAAKPAPIPSTTGKRKRQAAAEHDSEASSAESLSQAPTATADSSDPGSDDDNADFEEQLKVLKQKDPEFHKHLQDEDPELLAFAEDADLAEVDALSGSDDEDGPKKKKQKKSKREDAGSHGEDAQDRSTSNEVRKAMVKKWQTAMSEQHSLRATREVVLAFRAAAHVSDEDGKEYKYSVSSPEVYHELLTVALKHVPEVLQHHLPIKETAAGKIRVPTDSKKYRSLSTLLKSHSMSVLHLLAHLSDTSTLRITLSSLIPLLPYILSFKKLVRDLAKTVVSVWSDSANAETTRVSAFLVLRRLTVIGDPGIKEAILKTTYQGLVKGSRNTTVHTLAGINLMKNTAAELWSIDASVGYTTGFTFIRQLAIHLRSSITNNANESYKTVYNWQYIHSLDFWSRVLAAHCDALTESERGAPSPLRPLIYPVVQITLGAMRLIPTSTYFPLRFHLIRSLLRISLATGTYIPLAPVLYEVLNSAEMRKPPRSSTLKPLDFSVSTRAPKSYLKTRVYQDGIGEQIQELLSEFFVLWAKSIAFPELALAPTVLLKRWLKDVNNRSTGNKNGKVDSGVALLVQKLEANSRWIEERRAKVEFAPDDRAGVEGFLRDVDWTKTPLGAYVQGQRKGREERARLIEEGRREEERKNASEKGEKTERKDIDEFGGEVSEVESEEESE